MTPKTHITLSAKLTDRLVALGDGRDCTSQREKDAYRQRYGETQHALTGLRNAPADLARAEAELAVWVERRDVVQQKHDEIATQLIDAPDWNAITDVRERDREFRRQEHLKLSLQRLHDGRLLRAPGVVYEPLSYLESRIAELTAMRDQAQRTLDSHIKAADALLAVAV
jgi:hypothetical protein